MKYCDAIKVLYGEDVEACAECRHNACEHYSKAKRDWMDDEQDYEDRGDFR